MTADEWALDGERMGASLLAGIAKISPLTDRLLMTVAWETFESFVLIMLKSELLPLTLSITCQAVVMTVSFNVL